MGYNRQQNTMKKGMILLMMAAALVMGGQVHAQKWKMAANVLNGKSHPHTVKPKTPSIPRVSTTLTPYRGVHTTTNYAHPTLYTTGFHVLPAYLPDTNAGRISPRISNLPEKLQSSIEIFEINEKLFEASKEQPYVSPLIPKQKKPRDPLCGGFDMPMMQNDTLLSE